MTSIRGAVIRAIFPVAMALVLSACSRSTETRGYGSSQTGVSPRPSPGFSPLPRPSGIASAGACAPRAEDPLLRHENVACQLVSAGGTCHHIIADLSTSTGPSVVRTLKLRPPYLPGERVCIKAGNYPFGRLVIEDVAGAAGKPIQFINCGGQVIIGNTQDANADGKIDASRGMEFNLARHVKVSGTGSRSHLYGFKLAGTQAGIPSLSFSGLSTDMEVENFEITRSGFSGIMAKTDPGCTDTDPTSFRGGFVMRNASFHDCYIHDLDGGEGFYVGYSFFQGNTAKCPGSTIYSHPLFNTKIFNNRLENIACEAIQVGMGENSHVFNNYIRGFGTDPFASFQNNAIQIGGGTSGRFYNNYIQTTAANTDGGNGFMIGHYKDTLVSGNVIVGRGIYVHKDAGEGWDGVAGPYRLTLANNTIFNSTPSTNNRGIWSFNSVLKMSFLNNLILLADPLTGTGEDHVTRNAIYDQTVNQYQQIAGQTGANITQTANIKGLISRDQLSHFNAPAAYDFSLRTASTAVNAGTSISTLGVPNSVYVDHPKARVLNCPRISGAAVDIGAFERF